MTAIAASAGVSIGVSMNGKSKCSSTPGHVGVDQHAAEHRAEDDRGHGEALDPAVRHHELAVRQVLGEDAVLRRRIRRGAQADHGVGKQRMRRPSSIMHAADDLHAVGDEHHLALGQAVGEGAHARREHHVGDDEEELEVAA